MENNINNNNDYIPLEIMNVLINPISTANMENLFPQQNKLLTKVNYKNMKPPKLLKFLDITAIRGDELSKINVQPEKISIKTMIPDEFHVIKDESKSYLEYEDHEPTTKEEVDRVMVVFPTEFPQSRHEVKYLQKTLNQMLTNQDQPDLQIDQYYVNNDDDIDQMIELIGQLDGIYNIIFHELARQIMSSSEPRGNIVLELRNKYMDLVCKLPKELSKLKSEVKDQLVKDKMLTNQIEEFQTAIRYLTEQLKEVKERDIKVTDNAENIHKELEAALQDSVRSKELLNEYHVLYDLQKQRLDKHMSVVNNEKEEWSSLAFALSLKISDESLLNTSKRLRLVTKKLFQLSQHFAIYISDCDTVLTSKIQDLSSKCLKQITKLHTETNKTMNNFYDLFHFLNDKFASFTKFNLNELKNQFNIIENNLNSLKSFLAESSLSSIFTDISSDSISNYRLINQSVNNFVKELKDNVVKLYTRTGMQHHNSDTNNDQLVIFSELFEAIESWNNEFTSRINTIGNFDPFFNDMKSCIAKIELQIENVRINNNECDSNESIEFIITLVNDLYLEMFSNDQLKAIEKNENFTEFNKFYNSTQMSLVSFSNTIDRFDSELMETIINQQSTITNWIIDALFLFSNMGLTENIEMQFKEFSDSFESIVSGNNKIFHYTMEWTERFSSDFDRENIKIEMDDYESENKLWTGVAEMLINDIGNKIEKELINRRRKSEKLIEEMSLESLNEFLCEITERSNDSNMFLAIGTVKHLQAEIDATVARIVSASEKQALLSKTLLEQNSKIKDLEDKLAVITAEYRELVKTDGK